MPVLNFSHWMIIAATTTLVLVSSCSEDPIKVIEYPASNLLEDNYFVGDEWQLVWSDEFDGEQLDTDNWNRQLEDAGRFNDEWQRYTDSPANAYLESGCLVIKAMHEGDMHEKDKYTSARLNTAGKRIFKYGKIAARIQLPYGEGVWPAFWMLGANIDENGGDTPWPQSGEIDILEMYGSKDDGAVEANIHYAGLDGKHQMLRPPVFSLEKGRFAEAFHVFELEWDEQRIAWLVDGEEFASVPIDSVERSEFHKHFFILLNVAVGGRWSGRPNDRSVFPQLMYVDWVRVYQKHEGA